MDLYPAAGSFVPSVALENNGDAGRRRSSIEDTRPNVQTEPFNPENERLKQKQQQKQSPSFNHSRRKTDEAIAKVKRHDLDELRSFEGRRSEYFVNQFHKHNVYWQALCEVTRQRKQSLDRLLHLYVTRTAAYRSFSKSLYEVNDALTGGRKGSTREATARNVIKLPSSNCNSELSSASIHTPPSPPHSLASVGHFKSFSQGMSPDRSPVLMTGLAAVLSGQGTIVDEMCASDCLVARAVEDYCNQIDTQVIPKLRDTAIETAAQADALMKEGDKALATLQSVDMYAAKLFEDCHRIVAENLLAPGEGTPQTGKLENGRRDSEGDVWLVEMRYRVAAMQQKEAGETICTLLQKNFEKMREIEARRADVIKTSVQNTLDNTNALWAKLPNTMESTIMCVASMKTDVESAAEKVNSTMQSLGEEVEIEPVPEVIPFFDRLGMPLESTLVIHSGMLERKQEGVVKKLWVPCLCVLTADRFLHFFDLDGAPGAGESDEGGATGALLLPAKDAFKVLQPHIGATDTLKSKRDEKAVMITPAVSLDVTTPLVGARTKPRVKPKHELQFEVTEVLQNAGGVRGIFQSDKLRRKVFLQAATSQDLGTWMSVLHPV